MTGIGITNCSPAVWQACLQARGSAGLTPDKTSIGQAVRKLESLIKQLDSLLPYLSVAINAVNLLNAGATYRNNQPINQSMSSFTLRAKTVGLPLLHWAACGSEGS